MKVISLIKTNSRRKIIYLEKRHTFRISYGISLTHKDTEESLFETLDGDILHKIEV